MRLLTKISYYHFLLSVLVLGLVGFVMFAFLRKEISSEIKEKLELQTDLVVKEIQSGRAVSFPLVEIIKGDHNLMKFNKVFKDTLIYDHLQHVNEEYYYLAESKQINSSYYRIKVMRTYIGWENYLRTIIYMFLFIAVMLITFGTLINYLISHSIWSPFLVNLKRMNDYSVSSDTKLQLIGSDVKEFQEMNLVLTDLAERGKKEYTTLKQFTENASHEIQTPLSILNSKLERMGQYPLDPKLIHLLTDAKFAVRRLTKVNRGLLLLAKIENDAFRDMEWIAIDKAITRNYNLVEDLFHHKQLHVKQRISPTQLFVSSSLMDILISNMLSNMLNYSLEAANVSIVLDGQKLIFSNEAPPLTFPEENLFHRFSKGTEGIGNSNGLGLSIVKQICIINNWRIAYNYKNKTHIFSIEFH